jgi:hypothetical protein
MVEMRSSVWVEKKRKWVWSLGVLICFSIQTGCKTGPIIKEQVAPAPPSPARSSHQPESVERPVPEALPPPLELPSPAGCVSPRAQALKDTQKWVKKAETGLAFFTDVALPLNPLDYQRLNRMGVLILEVHWKRQAPMQWGERDGLVLVESNSKRAPLQLSCREILVEDGEKDLLNSSAQPSPSSSKSKKKLSKQIRSGRSQLACFFPYSSIFKGSKIFYRDLMLRKSIPVHSFQEAKLKPPHEDVKNLAPDPNSKVDAMTAIAVIRRRECQVPVNWK